MNIIIINKFETVRGNLKCTWKVINELLNKGKNNAQCESIQVAERILEDKKDITN